MKKLQRFGVVSLAALTLASLTLANDQLVKADETTPAETNVAPLEPVEELDNSREDEAVDSPTETSEETEEADLSQPASSAPSTPTEHKTVWVNMNHYLITSDGLHSITGSGVGLDSRYPNRTSVKPEPMSFANLDFVGARLSDDKVVNFPYDLSKTLSLEDGLSSNTTVNFYYKSKDLELSDTSDYANLPESKSNNDRISFRLSYVDDTGRALPGVEDIQYYNLIPGSDLEFVSPDVPGFRAKQASVLASYEALKKRPNEAEYGVSRYLRFVYEKVDNSAVADLDVAVVHVRLSDTKNDFKVLEEKKYTVKSGESLTIQAIDVEGFKPVTKTLTLDYDSLARGHIFGRAYQLYYTKDGQVPEWLKHIGEGPRTGLTGDPIPNFSDKLTINHIFDDGSAAPRKEVEVLPLRPDGSVMVPAFREVAGWMPDRSRSTQLSVELPRVPYFLKGGGLSEPFAEHVGYRYENLLTAHVFDLYYTKADTKVEEPKEPNTGVDTKPTQPTDTDTSTPTDNTIGNAGTVVTPTTPDQPDTGSNQSEDSDQSPVNKGNTNTEVGQTGGSDNGGETTPVTPPSDNNGENQTNPTETPSTDTTVDNGGTSDVGVDTNVTDSTKTEVPVDNTGNVGKEDGKTAESASQTENAVNNTGTSDTGEETNTTVPTTSVNSDTILSPETSADATDNEDSEVIFPIVVLDDKTDTSTSSEAAKTLASQKGERQDSLVKKQTLSRVESRHLPKTNDGHNVLAVIGVTILMVLGLYQPNKRKL